MGLIKDANGDLIYDVILTAHRFNDYIASVFTYEDLEDLPNVQSMYNGEPEEMLNDIEINETKVMKKLISLNPTKSAGNDGIVPIVLTKAAEELTYPITKLYRRSTEKSEVPEDGIISNVVPIIFKKD